MIFQDKIRILETKKGNVSGWQTLRNEFQVFTASFQRSGVKAGVSIRWEAKSFIGSRNVIKVLAEDNVLIPDFSLFTEADFISMLNRSNGRFKGAFDTISAYNGFGFSYDRKLDLDFKGMYENIMSQ